MMKSTGQGVYGSVPFGYRDPDTEEPCEAKVSSAQQSLWDVRFGSVGGAGDCPTDHNLGGLLFYRNLTRTALFFYGFC